MSSAPGAVWLECFNQPCQVGITLRNASKGALPLPTLILRTLDERDGGGFAWTSYDTGEAVNPFRPEHVEILSLTHSLAVTGKVLVAALEAFPSFSKGLQYLKVDVMIECVFGVPGCCVLKKWGCGPVCLVLSCLSTWEGWKLVCHVSCHG